MNYWTLFLSVVLFCVSSQPAAADPYRDATSGRSQKITASYFGMHFHRLMVLPSENAVPTQWPAAMLGSVRIWDAGSSWRDVAPRAGVWDFDRMDTFMNAAAAHQASVLYVLGSTPRWASARPDEKCSYGYGCAAESVRIDHWDEYVRRVAQRYGNQISAYELWNEPNFSEVERDRNAPGFYTGSVVKMVEMAQHARKILDEITPGAKLCTPGFVGGPDRLELFLAAGGNKYVQAICYHFYSDNSADFVRYTNEVRAVMQRTGVSALPLWNTETGIDTIRQSAPPAGVSAMTLPESSARLGQMLTLGAAAGFEHFYYYAWDNERSGMVTKRGEHVLGYQAFQRMQSWLLEARLGECSTTNDLVQCNGTRRHERFIVAWAAKEGTYSLNIPNGWKIAGIDRLIDGALLPVDAARKDTPTLLMGPMPIRVRMTQAARP